MAPKKSGLSLPAKLALAFCAACLFGAMAVPLAVRRYLPPEKLKALVVTEARKALGREVRLGEVSVGMWSGLKLRDFAISESPDFSKGTFASVGAFSVSVSWAPLLQRKIVVDSVAAADLSVRVVKHADGTYNFSDLLAAGKSAQKAPAGKPSDAPPMTLAVSGMKLEGGRVEYLEPAAGRKLVLSGLQAKVSGFSPDARFHAEVSGGAEGRWDGKDVAGKAAFSGSVDLGGMDPAKLAVEAKTLEVSAKGWTLAGSGSVKGLGATSVDAKLSIAGPPGPVGEAAFKGVFSTAPLAAKGELAFETTGLKAEDAVALGIPGGAPLPRLKAQSTFEYGGDAVSFKTLSVSSDFGGLTGAGTAKGLSSGKLEAELDVKADLKLPAFAAAQAPWLKLPAGLSVPAMEVTADASVKGETLELRKAVVKGAAGTAEATGRVTKLRTEPEPELDVKLALSLPALTSKDLAFLSVPPGLAVPASRWNGAAWISRNEARVPSLEFSVGASEFKLENARAVGLKGETPAVTGLLRSKRYDLAELTSITKELKQLGVKGTGYFAVVLSGRLPRPTLEGKVLFKDLGADMPGLKIGGFEGTASFSDRRIDIPNLKGDVGAGRLELDLTVKEYAKAPEIEVQGSLTVFDAGAWMAAKEKLEAGKPAESKPDSKAEERPIAAKGRFTIGRIVHPNLEARDLRMEWALDGITPSKKHLDGTAKFYSPGGRLINIERMVVKGFIKAILSPIMLIHRAVSLGGRSLNEIPYSEVTGDYYFKSGIMHLRDSRLKGDIEVATTGTVNLVAETQALVVRAELGNPLPPIEVEIGGTFEKPDPKVRKLKAVLQGLENLLLRK